MVFKSLTILNKTNFWISCQFRSSLSSPTRYFCSKMTDLLLGDFNKAKESLASITDMTNDDKLKLYGLFKQATIGPCNVAKPSSFDFVGKAKFDAWNSLGNLSKEEAMKKYIAFVNEVTPSTTKTITSNTSSEQTLECEGILYSIENNITRITLSRPDKKNALTIPMYSGLSSALKKASENDTAFAVLTGTGDYFCSGNDLSNFLGFKGDIADAAKSAGSTLKSFVASFIDFPKPLVAAVNGPAIGISVTCLGLCDIVYASEKATFHTPFNILGQTPEGCSTYTFPKIMGHSMANEVLLFNKKLTAEEAHTYKLVSEVFPQEDFKSHLEKRLSAMTNGSKHFMLYSKQLMRANDKEILHKVNAAECERLVERWQSTDCMEAIAKFFQRKSNL